MDFEYEFLSKFELPYFFDDPSDPALKEMQAHIRNGLDKDTVTLRVEMEQWLIETAEKKLSEIGWTLEEGMILFLKWSILFPERVSAWLQHIAMRKLRRFEKPYRDEDKLPVSRLESDAFDTALEEVQRDGMKVIVDADGKEKSRIMAWWFWKAVMQVLAPEHATEQIDKIEKACAAYKEEMT